jgi:hypothetical protein
MSTIVSHDIILLSSDNNKQVIMVGMQLFYVQDGSLLETYWPDEQEDTLRFIGQHAPNSMLIRDSRPGCYQWWHPCFDGWIGVDYLLLRCNRTRLFV